MDMDIYLVTNDIIKICFLECLRVVDEFMQNNCWMGLIGDWTMPAELDVMLRGTGARNQVACRHIRCVTSVVAAQWSI